MIIIRNLMPIVVAVFGMLSLGTTAAAAELYYNQELLSEPSVKAEVIGKANKGAVKIAERRGYWVKIRSGNLVGWSKLYHVKMKVDESFLMPPIDALKDTGRLGAGK